MLDKLYIDYLFYASTQFSEFGFSEVPNVHANLDVHISIT